MDGNSESVRQFEGREELVNAQFSIDPDEKGGRNLPLLDLENSNSHQMDPNEVDLDSSPMINDEEVSDDDDDLVEHSE